MFTQDEKYPYRLTRAQVDRIASVIGDHISMVPQAQSINNEIGIAPARGLISKTQNRILRLLGNNQDEHIVLMLTDDEIAALKRMPLPRDIQKELFG